MRLKGMARPYDRGLSVQLADFPPRASAGLDGAGSLASPGGVSKPGHYVWIPWDWMCAANRLGGSALAVGALLWYRSRVTGFPEVILSNVLATSAGLSRKAKTGGLRALVEGGLARMEGGPGRSPKVELLPVVRLTETGLVRMAACPADGPKTLVGGGAA